jgi:phage virion morphogenesis protein
MYDVEFNVDAIAAQLRRAGERIGDLTPVHREIGEYMIEATKARFRSSEAPDGTKWRAKSPVTIERYKRAKDGNLPQPLIGPSRRLSTEILAFANRAGVEIGSALEYSAVQQFGAAKGAFGNDQAGRPIPWGAIPARPFLGVSSTDERNILDIVEEHLADALGVSGSDGPG